MILPIFNLYNNVHLPLYVKVRAQYMDEQLVVYWLVEFLQYVKNKMIFKTLGKFDFSCRVIRFFIPSFSLHYFAAKLVVSSS